MTSITMNVNTLDLRRASVVVEEGAIRCQMALEKLFAEIGTLHVQWEGQSSDTFDAKLKDHMPDFAEWIGGLRACSDELAVAAEAIESNERGITDAIRQLPGFR